MPKKIFKKNKEFNMKSKGKFNFGKTMDLNVDRYGPSAGETKAQKKYKFTK